MAEIVQGLFGMSPSQMMQDRAQTGYAQDLRAVQLSPMQQANLALRQGGRGIAEGAIAPLLGVQDQDLQKAQMAQQLAANYDFTSPESLKEYAKALAQNGMPEFAQIAMTKAQEMQSKGLNIEQTQMNIKKTQQATDREEQLRKALSELPEDATEQDYLKVYRQFGSPDQQARIIEMGINAKAKNAPKELTPEQQQAREDSAMIAVDTVDEARKLTSNWSAGYGSLLAGLPSSDARKLQGKLDTIKSNLAAAMLEDLKSQSRTGASGLGALNKEELKVLQTSKASLDAGMGVSELNKSLNVIDKYFRARAGLAPLQTDTGTTPAGPKGKPGSSRDNAIKLD